MNRRTLIAGATASAILPGSALAQAPRVVRVGLLILSNGDVSTPTMRDALRRRGLIEGQNLALEVRDAHGDAARLPALANELVALKPDVILAVNTPTIIAARRATSTIPIVMAPAGDPIGTGFISNLARPGGNLTGVSSATAEAAGKMVELISEAIPGARRIGVLLNSADDFAKSFLAAISAASQSLGGALRVFNLTGQNGQEQAFATLAEEKWQAVIVQPSLVWRPTIELQLRHKLPTVCSNRPFAEAGGLISYSAALADLHFQAAEYVRKIAAGQPPGEMPVQQPTRIELILNLKTARAIGVEFPNTFIARADEVIE